MVAGMFSAMAVGAIPAPDAATRAEAREIFQAIVAIESSAGRGQVPAVANYLAERLRRGGFAAEDIRVVPLGDTASLVVRYRGSGGAAHGALRPILFLSHLDVVTAKRSDWQRDPFVLVEENGYFFGRGTLDVKGETALMVATLLRLKREHFVPARDLILACTGDEETAEATALDLITRHRDLVDAEFALNGDYGGGVLDEAKGRPFLYFLRGAEKTAISYTLTTRNPGGHSSRPRADNAIYELADALKAVQAYRFALMSNEWTIADFKAEGEARGGSLGAAMTRFAANPQDAAAAAEIARRPEDVGKLGTTCVATLIQGGHADNALPQSATATVNCRLFPGMSAPQVLSILQGLVGPKVEVRQVDDAVVSEPSPLRPDVLAAVTRAVQAANPGARIVPTQVSYATDGAIFRAYGIPTYGVGSLFIKDSEDFAHGLNERIPVESFYRGLTHWYVLMRAVGER
jgi:acetylornithine deacetylase/succinyl-diaminopimelate desuccinylase-like protein